MIDSLKADLEFLVIDFKNNLYTIKIKDFNNPQLFVNRCQELLNNYRFKMLNSVNSLSSYRPISEYFLEEYLPSLKYHSECQLLFENYIEKTFSD